MLRRFVALAAGMAVGLGTAVPASAAPTLAATGDATSVGPSTADLHAVVYREHVGARWFFEWSASRTFDAAVVTTTPTALRGRLVAVERAVTGLTPGTTYYWRVVVVVRQGTRTLPTFGATKLLTTAAAPPPAASPPPASGSSSDSGASSGSGSSGSGSSGSGSSSGSGPTG